MSAARVSANCGTPVPKVASRRGEPIRQSAVSSAVVPQRSGSPRFLVPCRAMSIASCFLLHHPADFLRCESLFGRAAQNHRRCAAVESGKQLFRKASRFPGFFCDEPADSVFLEKRAVEIPAERSLQSQNVRARQTKSGAFLHRFGGWKHARIDTLRKVGQRGKRVEFFGSRRQQNRTRCFRERLARLCRAVDKDAAFRAGKAVPPNRLASRRT